MERHADDHARDSRRGSLGVTSLLLGSAAMAIVVATARGGAANAEPTLVTESYTIQSGDPGITLYVRNKRPEGRTQFPSSRILLFVHGATYPSEAAFDLELGGLSWMDYIARRGFDVYLMDIRGYGQSARPSEMGEPATQHPPIVHTDVAVRDLRAIVEHIRARRGVARINLMGWSWGTAVTGAYTAQHPDTIERLVLYAPLWLLAGPPRLGGDGPLGAYRTVTKEAAKQRWIRGVPAEKLDRLIPPGYFEAWWAAVLASDPSGAAQDPPVVRAPNGVVDDLIKYWAAGKAYYDPSAITAPVLLVHAEWDADTPAHMAQAVFARLTSAPWKRYVVIGEGTHTVALERNRMQLFREVQLFLEDEMP